MLLTRTWIKATDSDGLRLTVQAQADGVVSGVAQRLPLLRPVTTGHGALEDRGAGRSKRGKSISANQHENDSEVFVKNKTKQKNPKEIALL